MTRLRRWLNQPRQLPRWELYCYALVFWTAAARPDNTHGA